MFKRFPFIHNHGDFVHLDALRDWLRGVVSLETFLKSKDDKAIVKDMHFTDERTTVDYIDTKDDTEKTETLCEYLTSDVFDETNPNQFNKVDKISFIKNENGERRINVREKNNKKQRLSVILSNIPIAYDATTDTYNGTSKSHHIGVNENGVKIYNDETLQVIRQYKYGEVKRYAPADYRYFMNILDVSSPTNTDYIDFTQSYIEFFAINNKVISAQAKVHLTNSISIESGSYKVLRMITSGNESDVITSDFIKSELVFPKTVRCSNNTQDNGKFVITSINQLMQNNNLPITNGDFYISFYNPTNQAVTVNDVVIAY